jgi:hypothetical protein
MTRSQRGTGNTLALLLSFGFGVTFVLVLLALAVFIPKPTATQLEIFRIVIAIAIAGIAAVVPGFLNLNIGQTKDLAIRAGGALAVFVIVYFYSPAHWVATPEKPNVKVEVNKTEHGYYISFIGDDNSLPKETPKYSFIHEGGPSPAAKSRNPRSLSPKTPQQGSPL